MLYITLYVQLTSTSYNSYLGYNMRSLWHCAWQLQKRFSNTMKSTDISKMHCVVSRWKKHKSMLVIEAIFVFEKTVKITVSMETVANESYWFSGSSSNQCCKCVCFQKKWIWTILTKTVRQANITNKTVRKVKAVMLSNIELNWIFVTVYVQLSLHLYNQITLAASLLEIRNQIKNKK